MRQTICIYLYSLCFCVCSLRRLQTRWTMSTASYCCIRTRFWGRLVFTKRHLITLTTMRNRSVTNWQWRRREVSPHWLTVPSKAVNIATLKMFHNKTQNIHSPLSKMRLAAQLLKVPSFVIDFTVMVGVQTQSLIGCFHIWQTTDIFAYHLLALVCFKINNIHPELLFG